MPEIGELYTSATWVVKEGKESEFVAAWTAFADWTARRAPGAGVGHLLQEVDQPRHFLSFGPWASQDAIGRWREAPEFRSFFATARELCDDIQPRTLALAARVP